MVARRSYAIVFAFLIMMLSLVLISFGTYALFTSQKQVHGHLESGTLAVKVERIKAISSYLDTDTGKIIKITDTNAVELNDTSDVNSAFNMPVQAIIVPTCKEIATFKVSHADGSNVAFDYYLKFDVTSGQTNKDAEDKALKLAEQLKVTVELLDAELEVIDGGTKVFTVSELAQAVKSAENPIAEVEVGKVSYFRVTVEFVDHGTELDNANNSAMDQNVYFDMTIVAKQSSVYVD